MENQGDEKEVDGSELDEQLVTPTEDEIKIADAGEKFKKLIESDGSIKHSEDDNDHHLENFASIYASIVHVATDESPTKFTAMASRGGGGGGGGHGSFTATSSDITLVIQPNGDVVWRNAGDDDLDQARAMYVWDEDSLIQKPPHVKEVPKQDDVTTASPFGGHTLFNFRMLLKLVKDLGIAELPGDRPAHSLTQFAEYTDNTPKPSDDEYFVQQRLQGANACSITLLTDEVLSDVNEALKHSGAASLERSANETLYMLDYFFLKNFSMAIIDQEKYVPAPVLVLSYANSGFKAKAIMYDRANRYQGAVLPNGSMQWEFGKMCVRAADWNAHELGSHLTLTHLVSEVALVNAHRCLPKSHPVLQLLLPHFYNTLPLNDNARKVLVPKIIANKLTPWTLDQCLAIDSQFFNSWNFEAHYLPKHLRDRGVADLPENVYPYGAAASLAWKHVHTYVHDALEELAAKGNDIMNDVYIRLFCDSMRDSAAPGQPATGIPGFPDVQTLEQLCDALTMIIFTASYQHSAVNYFQDQFMGYVPNAPPCLGKAPSPNLINLTDKSLMHALPTPRIASVATSTLEMLSQHPENNHRLVEFKASDGVPEFVQWNAAQGLLQAMQRNLKIDLQQLQARVGGEVAAVVTVNTLAQSVLI